MSSFPAQAGRVRDVDLPVRRRLLALRECALHFSPYGFRATWHHLVVNAGLPVCLEEDPDSLLRAVDELDEARQIWLADTHAFTARRRQEKAAGRRNPRREDAWHTWPGWLAFCPDPEIHPRERLAIVVHRLIVAYRSEAVPSEVCPACNALRPSLPCPSCGVCSWNPQAYPWNPAGVRPPGPPDTGLPWQLIWHRAVRQGTTIGGGRIGEFRAEFTPTSQDRLFGIFQVYVRGVALGDGTTTALYPHFLNLRDLLDTAELPGSREPQPLSLGDTFDHLQMSLETTDEDTIFVLATRQGWGDPPPWAPQAGRRMRLMVRRSEVVNAWHETESGFRQLLTWR
ncbi:hypothetical protein [Micromonospora narathiwatensis]|uniref:Uncharacterized protein n=1 Tax=Micromonospora narathiwatensis TaxID=299146 RepID=A0A1A8ZAI5_9ACTN|nr:hypothetical protein [Micromonospora narathiwatensis]SBT40885.1 hypothetical protein GA0070621_1082 [Micromonospora narathiwatensis]